MNALNAEISYSTSAWDKLLCELYDGREGCVFTLDRHEGKQRRYHVRKFRYMCEKRYITRHTDTYTPNIYWGLGCKNEEILPQNKYRRLAGNIEIVNTLALDIDHYKHYGWLKPMDFFYGHIEPLIGSVLPPPSYIEYGYGLRLIWVLSEPLKFKKGTTENRSGRPITKAYEATVKRLSEAVNKEVGVTVCEPQKLNSFYRIPGSRNEKTGDIVELEAYSEERYTLQEIMDEYLPELPKWYVERDIVVAKKNSKVTRIHNTYQLWIDRLLKLEEIAETETAINRQNLCFVYLNGLIQTGYEHDLMDAVLAFNKKLINPLPEKELKSKLGWQIKMRIAYGLYNDRINELIGIEAFTKAKWTKREREKARKEANGTTRKQIAERNRTRVLELKEQGLTTKEIAEQVGLKPQTVKNIVGKARKEARH